MPSQGDLQFALGYWIVSHKQQLRTWWVLALLGFIGVSLIWTVTFFTVYLAQEPKLDQQVAASAQAIAALQAPASITPLPLTIDTPTVIARDAHRVDLAAFVHNRNANWGASSLTVHFRVNGGNQPEQTVWVNPASDRPVIQLNVKLDAASSAKADLIIDRVEWARVNDATLPAPAFVVGDPVFTPVNVTNNGAVINGLNAQATVTNRSVYNYYHVQVPIIIQAGATIVAVDQVDLSNWATLTDRLITVTWSYPVAGATSATIAPQVNRFDRDNVYH